MDNSIAIILYVLSTITAFAFIFGALMIKWPKTFCKDEAKAISKTKKMGWLFLLIAIVLFVIGNVLFIVNLGGL